MNYPNETGFVAHSETSRASARALDESGRAGSYDDLILRELMARGVHGMTAEEARKFLNRTYPHVHNGSVNGRMSTLWRRGSVVKTEETRQTDAKKQAHVYVHAMFRPMVKAMPDYSEAVGDDAEALRQLADMLMGLVWEHQKDGGARIDLTPLDLHIAIGLARRAGIKGRF